MRIEWLKEFSICAQELSLQQAAKELYISQSNLSRHMKQLENELQVELFHHANNRIYLTKAGSYFQLKTADLLSQYNSLLEDIEQSETNKDPKTQLTVQQHSYIDASMEKYYQTLFDYQKQTPDTRIYFSKSSRRRFVAELQSGSIDVCLIYRYGQVNSIINDFSSEEISAYHLATEPLSAWCHKSIARNRDCFTIEDLRDYEIFEPVDVCAPMRSPLVSICEEHGFFPRFFTVSTTCQPEFLIQSARYQNAIFVYPQTFLESRIFKSNIDMVTLPFLNPEAVVHSFILVSSSSQKAEPFRRYLINSNFGDTPTTK